MSTSKHFNFIAICAAIAALVITLLFMNGEAFGLQRYVSDGNAMFTQADLDDSWDTGGAARITLTGDGAEIDGAGAYLQDGNVIIYAGGDYILEGTLENGSVIVNETSKTKGTVRILLNGVTIRCEDSAALDVEEATKVILTLAEGTENVLESGEEYSEDAEAANIRGTLFSRDDLTINGSGSLSVTAGYRHGIVCNDDFRITGGTITVSAKEDGIHVNESARFTGMELTINAGDDGITVSDDENKGELTVGSGTILIESCAEGMESEKVTIDGGNIEIWFTDDGINAGGAEPLLTINGGTVTLICENGRDVDGMDSNGDIVINGGLLLVSVSANGINNAIDFASEFGSQCYINGGTVIAAGSGGMAEAMSAESAQCSVMYGFSSTNAAGGTVRLEDTEGNVILEAEIPCSYSSLILSDPALEMGGSYVLIAGEETVEIEMTETALNLGTVSGGMGGFGAMGGFEPGGFRPGRGKGNRNETGADAAMAENADEAENADAPMSEGEMPAFEGGIPEMPEFDGEFPGNPPADGEMQFPPADGEMQFPPAFNGDMMQGGPPDGFMNGWDQNGTEQTGMSEADVKTALLISAFSLCILLAGIGVMSKARNTRNIT
ncbi:MAG: carbohydrate-binding domain-containing protein [Lachnospiraceae bacterium]|nr:carbohydrate-binding domain-containing protein [Lachnospiraceae bacterium]